MKYANGNAMIASVIVTAAAIETVRNANGVVRRTRAQSLTQKLSSVQLWIVSEKANGSTVQNE